ncbi:VIP peptides [Sphaerodactylus townsendi]|uniref:VIP peptides n=1 Tax=Sphaerodactylus townsendi TaxID=933632 RepID=UPI002026CF3E|nr:VIP peptides [Sphaerodactylus townsendi]
MEHRNSSQLLLSFTLLCILCSRALALPPLESYSALRLGNRMPFDGASESDQAQGSLKLEADILQTTLPDNDKLYYDISRALDRNTRHTDGLFTSEYSRMLGQLTAQKYLDSLIGKRTGNENLPEEEKRHSDGLFTDNYSRLRKQMATKKYLDSLFLGKRRPSEDNLDETPSTRDDDFF